MKNIYKFLLGLCTVFPALTSCEKDLPVYNNEACGLMFEYKYERDSVFGYSFAFGPSDVTIDTVFMKVSLLGNVTDYDRPIALQQVLTGKNDARPGEHYVPFDDPSLASKYILPAKTAERREGHAPVVYHPDLETVVIQRPVTKLVFQISGRRSRLVQISTGNHLMPVPIAVAQKEARHMGKVASRGVETAIRFLVPALTV